MNKQKNNFKIIILGESNVGKTTIFHRFIGDKILNNTATVGVEFKIKEFIYNNNKYTIQLYDTAGQERFRCVTQAYYRIGDGYFVVFDLSNKDSLDSVKYWIQSIIDMTQSHNIIILGNKDDIQQQISDDIIKKTIEQFNIKYIKTSALKNKNISQAFEEMIKLIKKNNNNKKENESIPLSKHKTSTKVRCCG